MVVVPSLLLTLYVLYYLSFFSVFSLSLTLLCLFLSHSSFFITITPAHPHLCPPSPQHSTLPPQYSASSTRSTFFQEHRTSPTFVTHMPVPGETSPGSLPGLSEFSAFKFPPPPARPGHVVLNRFVLYETKTVSKIDNKSLALTTLGTLPSTVADHQPLFLTHFHLTCPYKRDSTLSAPMLPQEHGSESSKSTAPQRRVSSASPRMKWSTPRLKLTTSSR